MGFPFGNLVCTYNVWHIASLVNTVATFVPVAPRDSLRQRGGRSDAARAISTEREGKAVAREAHIQDVWVHKYDVGSNVVDAVIKTLRKKLGAQSELIETVAGYGYKFRAAE